MELVKFQMDASSPKRASYKRRREKEEIVHLTNQQKNVYKMIFMNFVIKRVINTLYGTAMRCDAMRRVIELIFFDRFLSDLLVLYASYSSYLYSRFW